MSDRNAILDALTAKMEEIWNDDLSFADQAAAVLELVGPEPLEWDGVADDCFVTCVMDNFSYDLIVSDTLERPCDHVWSAYYCRNGHRDIPITRGKASTLEAAQAAAQAHADAAHWANTNIGGE